MNLGGVQRMIDGNDIKQIGSPINSYYAYKAVGFFQSDAEAQAYMDKYKGKEGLSVYIRLQSWRYYILRHKRRRKRPQKIALFAVVKTPNSPMV